jgi:hypothetical protein
MQVGVTDPANQNVELDIGGEGFAALQRERAEGRGIVEGGEGFGLRQEGDPFRGRGGIRQGPEVLGV